MLHLSLSYILLKKGKKNKFFDRFWPIYTVSSQGVRLINALLLETCQSKSLVPLLSSVLQSLQSSGWRRVKFCGMVLELKLLDRETWQSSTRVYIGLIIIGRNLNFRRCFWCTEKVLIYSLKSRKQGINFIPVCFYLILLWLFFEVYYSVVTVL